MLQYPNLLLLLNPLIGCTKRYRPDFTRYFIRHVSTLLLLT